MSRQTQQPDRITIRGLDPKLYMKARVAAVKADITIGQFMNQAIENYLVPKKS